MTDLAIRVENLGKQYRIGAAQKRHSTLRDAISDLFRINRKSEIENRKSTDTIWALKDVSFEVKRGEVVGIIGRNGAGKSTLLKILSSITKPTEGRVTLNGRVGSLLEVGTGFHAELTGRENIFLNGAILGMGKREIERKFDEIVAFAEVEEFIDTPVKHYSSGMYVRLAFAVAAHLEPEILVVDEVLAVGDVQFQKKCLGKMGDAAKEGRTVLFVSHNLPAITRICPRSLLLQYGYLINDGPSTFIANQYHKAGKEVLGLREWDDWRCAPGDDVVYLSAVRILDAEGKISDTLDIREPIILQMEYVVHKSGAVMRPWMILWNDENVCVFATTDTDPDWVNSKRRIGRHISSVIIPGNYLAEGGISVTVGMAPASNFAPHFQSNGVVSFQVVDSMDGNSARGSSGGNFPGVVRPKLPWNTKYL